MAVMSVPIGNVPTGLNPWNETLAIGTLGTERDGSFSTVNMRALATYREQPRGKFTRSRNLRFVLGPRLSAIKRRSGNRLKRYNNKPYFFRSALARKSLIIGLYSNEPFLYRLINSYTAVRY